MITQALQHGGDRRQGQIVIEGVYCDLKLYWNRASPHAQLLVQNQQGIWNVPFQGHS